MQVQKRGVKKGETEVLGGEERTFGEGIKQNAAGKKETNAESPTQIAKVKVTDHQERRTRRGEVRARHGVKTAGKKKETRQVFNSERASRKRLQGGLHT